MDKEIFLHSTQEDLQNHTPTLKHITRFQLHDASKLFSESVVALPFSQYLL